jgi:hypothetical protein
MLGGLALINLGGCVPDREPPEPTSVRVEHRQEAFSMVGIERVVPLRFVILVKSDPVVWPDIEPTWENLNNSVRMANAVHRPAGIQYTIESARRYVTPTLAASASSNTKFLWSDVVGELQLIYPNLLSFPSLPTTASKTVSGWVLYASTRFADPSQSVVYVAASFPQGVAASAVPYNARGTIFSCGLFASESVLAHELGHTWGLFHSQGTIGDAPSQAFPSGVLCDPSSAYDCDPYGSSSTSGLNSMAQWWDQVYRPGVPVGSPHTFFHSEAEATDAGTENLLWIHKTRYDPVADIFYHNCDYRYDAGAGLPDRVECRIWKESEGDAGVQVVNTDSDAGRDKLQGIARFSSNGAMSRNIMMGNPDAPAGYPYSLSNAQVSLMRRNLRYDTKISATAEPDLAALGLTGGRPLLGRAVRRPPLVKLDLDGDSKRDLVLWVPPAVLPGVTTGNASFLYYLSSEGYSTLHTLTNAQTGVPGDIPLAGDFDENGRMDLGIFHPPTGTSAAADTSTASWNLCLGSSAVPPSFSCLNWGNAGQRGDWPLPGVNFDDTHLYELARFRPSDGKVYWNIGATQYSTATLGGSGTTPFYGLFDDDDLTDVGSYDPATGVFRLLLSSTSWATPVVRDFCGGSPSTCPFVARSSGLASDRGGAIPITSLAQMRSFGTVSNARNALGLFDPATGYWSINWTPVTSATVNQYAWGGSGDIPLSDGLELREHDLGGAAGSHSSLAYYHTDSNAGPGSFSICNQPGFPTQGCRAPVSISTPGGQFRERAFALSDMGTDGKPELCLLATDTMTVTCYLSDTSYTTTITKSFYASGSASAHQGEFL